MAPFIYWEFLAACLGMSVRPPALYKQRLTSGPNLATFRLRPAARRHCHISSLHFQTNARRCRVLDSLGGEKARKERPSCPSPSSPLRNSLPIGRELEAAAVPKKVREKISARVASVHATRDFGRCPSLLAKCLSRGRSRISDESRFRGRLDNRFPSVKYQFEDGVSRPSRHDGQRENNWIRRSVRIGMGMRNRFSQSQGLH